ncbi:MAG: hypothetical protein K2W96_21925 [Gemmataceae bacterium]|nr:hypothetical protein [Gemmataceae bacterium]
MHLIQILLPLKDNEGVPHPPSLFAAVADELAERFGGLTAHTRAPAEGLWKPGGDGTVRDEIVVYEVMAEKAERRWWRGYRASLEERFRQERVVVVEQEARLL